MFSQKQRDIENKFDKVEYSGNGDDHNKGIIKDEKLISHNTTIDFDEALAAVIGDTSGNEKERKLTPHFCREGCKHYDGVNAVKDGKFKEFCWRNGGQKISNGYICGYFESKEVKQACYIVVHD